MWGDMGTLFLDRKDLRLAYEGQCLALYEQNAKRGTVPLHLLQRVVIRGQLALDTRVLAALADKDIGVLMLSGRNHRAVAMLFGKPHNDSQRRLGQYACYLDEGMRLRWSVWLVKAKLRNQKRLLVKAMAKRPDLRHGLSAAIATLNGILTQLADNQAGDLGQLRGFEGAGAAAYFKAFCPLFAPSLHFTTRQRRPPPDPVNACLSLGYTLLHFDAVSTCYACGLDPYIGFYHDPAFGRESLACDVIEPLRALLDQWVWRLFRERLLRAEHFSDDHGKCLMNKAGRQRFYAEYELFAKPVRRLLRRYGHALARRLLTDGKEPA